MDYRGNIGIILINHSDTDFEIKVGDRIGQIVLNKVEQVYWRVVDEIEDLGRTDRGSGGFGSSGVK